MVSNTDILAQIAAIRHQMKALDIAFELLTGDAEIQSEKDSTVVEIVEAVVCPKCHTEFTPTDYIEDMKKWSCLKCGYWGKL